MDELTFDADKFREVIADLVPAHQRIQVTSALDLKDPTEADFDRLGTALTGEQANAGFLFLTSTGNSSGNSLWSAIKGEIYDLFCTNSTRYSGERADGLLTIKNTITVIATAVAASFHLALGVVVGAVTLALMCFLKVGRNAWCLVNHPGPMVSA
ncbi:hypothetical protein [Polaromonas sp.]|uniref:hypothetical protein n=1 Tax=Polaromonas sp. TaxID=1869339 RepID=UPI0017AB8E11|nr:hypothetical protein [Polaromonas sp.]NMM07091.1 hypothetical protein [Polaromonas sp.]